MREKYFDLQYTLPDSGLVDYYVEGKRFYRTPEGNSYPSVTTVLSTLNKQGIEEWRQRVGEEEANKISRQASRRGTAVHLLAEKYMRNDDDWNKDAMPSNLNTFNQIKPYIDKWCDRVYANEIGLYSDQLKTAGRCDLVARIHGIRTICDFKTAKKAKKEQWITNYFYQCTTYALMLAERTNIWCPQICVLIATDEDGLQVFLKQTNQYKTQVQQLFNDFHSKNLLPMLPSRDVR